MIMKRIILTCTFFGFFLCAVQAQISTEEQPYSWGKREITIESIPAVAMPFLDMATIEEEDLENEGLPVPFRFGFPHDVNFSLTNSGSWKTTSDGGRLWTLKIHSPDARSLNLLYDQFWLPEGAKFFIYSTDMKEYIGAFTSQNNTGNRENNEGFATGFLFTNSIMLEYYEPAEVSDNGIISVAQVISGYRYVYNQTRGNLLPCHNDITCPEGNNWQKEKNAIAYITMGGLSCSGALLNTTANINTPVFLTADHCFVLYPSASQWIFYWHYEAPICGGNANTVSNKSTTGSTVLARRADTDFMLLKLTSDPASNKNVTPYYLGWDRTAVSATSGVCIHHPRDSVKKISITDNSINNHPSPITWEDAYGNIISITPANTHWKVSFTNGTTEGGSSGSPILNQNKRVVGQLHGGAIGCPSPNAPITKYYGRFDVSWDGANSGVRLRDHLDPSNTGVTTLDGIPKCDGNITISNKTYSSGTHTVTGCNINVQDVKVQNNAKLTLDAAGTTTINGDFEVQLGSELEIK